MLFNLVTTRKGVEGKANQTLQVLSPTGSTCEGRGQGDGRGWMSPEPGQTEERFGDATRGLRRVEGARKDSKCNKMYNLFGMTKKHGLLQSSTWEEIVVVNERSRLSLK